MIDGYLTINELAEKWDVTPRRIRAMCANGQFHQMLKDQMMEG